MTKNRCIGLARTNQLLGSGGKVTQKGAGARRTTRISQNGAGRCFWNSKRQIHSRLPTSFRRSSRQLVRNDLRRYGNLSQVGNQTGGSAEGSGLLDIVSIGGELMGDYVLNKFFTDKRKRV